MRFQLMHMGHAIPLTKTALIGRSVGCDVVLDGANVSRRHARIVARVDGASVEDLASAHGVFVNGERIDGTRPLHDGDEVRVGDHRLKYSGDAAAQTVRRATGSIVRESKIDSLWDEDDDIDEGESTDSGDGLALVGPAVEELLARGKVTSAEKTIAPWLEQILDAAQTSKHVDAATVASASLYALKLAGAGAGSSWLSYPIELHTATDTLLAVDAVDLLAKQLGDDVDAKAALARYLDVLRARTERLGGTQRETLQRLERLLS